MLIQYNQNHKDNQTTPKAPTLLQYVICLSAIRNSHNDSLDQSVHPLNHIQPSSNTRNHIRPTYDSVCDITQNHHQNTRSS